MKVPAIATYDFMRGITAILSGPKRYVWPNGEVYTRWVGLYHRTLLLR